MTEQVSCAWKRLSEREGCAEQNDWTGTLCLNKIVWTGRLCWTKWLNKKIVPEQGTVPKQDGSLNRKAVSEKDGCLNSKAMPEQNYWTGRLFLNKGICLNKIDVWTGRLFLNKMTVWTGGRLCLSWRAFSEQEGFARTGELSLNCGPLCE